MEKMEILAWIDFRAGLFTGVLFEECSSSTLSILSSLISSKHWKELEINTSVD